MSSDLAVSARGLGKSYTIRHNQSDHVTLAEVALDRIRHPLTRAEREQFWALREIDFDLAHGEVLGVVGRNGAGKSTLLKVLSRITDPTEGEVRIRGRVGSLLEVGTGFHPELTGRENIYLNGSILGMTRKEIDRQFDAIIEFAGVEQFLDTPVKRYSSGMYVRLAFAVAAHLENDLLILDEVLAVGDADFQKKCLERVTALARGGRTIILVSHNKKSVEQFATTAILLANGRLVLHGKPTDVLDAYETSGPSTHTARLRRIDRGHGRHVEIVAVNLDVAAIELGADLIHGHIDVLAHSDVPLQRLQVIVADHEDRALASSFGREVIKLPIGEPVRVRFSLDPGGLSPGAYQLSIAVGTGGVDRIANNLDFVVGATEVQIEGPNGLQAWNHHWWGSVRLPDVTVVDIAHNPDRVEGMG